MKKIFALITVLSLCLLSTFAFPVDKGYLEKSFQLCLYDSYNNYYILNINPLTKTISGNNQNVDPECLYTVTGTFEYDYGSRWDFDVSKSSTDDLCRCITFMWGWYDYSEGYGVYHWMDYPEYLGCWEVGIGNVEETPCLFEISEDIDSDESN